MRNFINVLFNINTHINYCNGGEKMPEEHEHEELSVEDIAFMANDKVDALIDLLIEKGVITEEEIVEKIDELYEEDEDVDDEEE